MDVKRQKSEWQDVVKERFRTRIFNWKLYENGNKVFIRIPGFKYDDFNRAGYLSASQVARLLLSQPITFHHHGQLCTLEQFGSNVVVVGRECTMTRRLHRCAAINLPMVLSWWPTRVGRTSFDVCNTLVEESTGLLLAKCVFRKVIIDSATKKAIPLPEALQLDYTKIVKNNTYNTDSFHAVEVPAVIPPDAFSRQVKVRYDDTDRFLHTNQGNYLEFFGDCAAQAAVAGRYSNVRHDIAFYPVLSVTSLNVGESYAGEELEVITWEDARRTFLLHCIVRRNDRMIFYAQMLLYNNMDDENEQPLAKL